MSTAPQELVGAQQELTVGIAEISWRSLVRFGLRNRMAGAGALLVAISVLVAIFGPLFAPHSPYAQDLADRLAGPSRQHLLGTDSLGRDILSRLLYGARLSLASGVGVVLVSLLGGLLLGTTAGYFRGAWDELVMRVTDMFLAFPGLILAMAIAAILHPSLTNALIAVAATWWPTYARLARGQTMAIKPNEYVEAARALGVGAFRIILRHIVPNALGPILVQATLDIGGIILTIAGLSFIGFGAQPPTPEWGLMVSDGRSYLATQWWVPTAPALAILFLVLGFNLAGDGLRDVLDPHTRR